MNPNPRALLLVGSLRKPQSTSEVLGSRFLELLKQRGWQAETLRLKPSHVSEKASDVLVSAVDNADLLVLAFPLYVDALPAQLTRALEIIAASRDQMSTRPSNGLFTIVNSGFPEARQNDVALAICREFAEQSGFKWMGGLALGGGGYVDGRSSALKGRLARNVVRALDLSAEAVSEGRPAPAEAVALMAKPLMPRWLYTAIANYGPGRRRTKSKTNFMTGPWSDSNRWFYQY